VGVPSSELGAEGVNGTNSFSLLVLCVLVSWSIKNSIAGSEFYSEVNSTCEPSGF